jgi:hypothetical protein
LLRNEQWLEVGAMQNEDKAIDCINIRALDVEQLLPKGNKGINEKALMDEHYRGKCKQISSGGNLNTEYSIRNDILCRKNRVYVPQGLRRRFMELDDDSKGD